jgi:hypothetical protein
VKTERGKFGLDTGVEGTPGSGETKKARLSRHATLMMEGAFLIASNPASGRNGLPLDRWGLPRVTRLPLRFTLPQAQALLDDDLPLE